MKKICEFLNCKEEGIYPAPRSRKDITNYKYYSFCDWYINNSFFSLKLTYLGCFGILLIKHFKKLGNL